MLVLQLQLSVSYNEKNSLSFILIIKIIPIQKTEHHFNVIFLCLPVDQKSSALRRYVAARDVAGGGLVRSI